MMKTANGMTLTNAGRCLLANALKGSNITFTRAFVGDGDIDPDTDILAMTDLVSRKIALPVKAIRTSRTGVAEVTVEVSNQELVAGFFMKEYGLFAKDSENGLEVLYSYCNKGNESGYLEGFDGTNPINFTLSLITVIDQAQNITAIIENNYSYVTANTLDDRFNSLFALHENPAGFFSYNRHDERRLRPTSLDDTRLALFGLADINSLINRVERLEDSINQITLALNVQEISPGASHYMAEDFINPDTVDLYSAQVTSVVAGDDSIDCLPLDGLLPGSFYTLTDGVLSELVQVKSVNLENGIMRVILTDFVQNTYNLENCRLIRTTADVSSGHAYGLGTVHSLNWLANTEWRGLSANRSFTARLDTVINSKNNFDFTGIITFNSDGYLTLKG